MDEFTVNDDLTAYSAEEIDTLIAQGNEALDALFALEDPTDEQVADAERISAAVDGLSAEKQRRTEAAAARTQRMTALREARTTATAEETEEASEEEEEEPEPPKAAPKAKASTRKVVAARTERPTVPENMGRVTTITAAADVPGYATGYEMHGLEDVGKALVNRMRGFPAPAGQVGGQMMNYGVASFRRVFADELTVKNEGDAQEVIDFAAKESRLSGGSLTAAGGWCAPSETLYDLCGNESLDGLIDLPQINVTRGGIRFTKGPDFGTLYAGMGFTQTEAQAIAGTAKACYEVVCPAFTEVRLDAIGVCVKAPILTNAAYPELVQRVISGAAVVHANRLSASLIAKMVTASGTVALGADLGAISTSILDVLDVVSQIQRQKYRLGFGATIEVVAPNWLKGAIRADLAARNGVELLGVTDEQINAYFAVRGVRVQFVYGWQELADIPTTPTGTYRIGWPATVQLMVYPAGTFVAGATDVINLSAVYDAAELSVNRYTGLFFEEGSLLANTCYNSNLIQVPVCAGGVTGANTSTACDIAVA